MPDILFKCPNCTKSLAVDGDVAGAEVQCVDCREKVVVPMPEFKFLCPSCKAVLSTAKGYHGHDFTCTECNGKVTVPLPRARKPQTPEASALPPKSQAPEAEGGEGAKPVIRMPKVKDEDYRRMAEGMGRRADALKPRRTPLWKRILYNVIGYAVGIAILYLVIGLFVDNQAVKAIMTTVISIILLCMILRFCLTSGVYDD